MAKDGNKSSWKEFIWNPRTREFCGRTASSWGKNRITSMEEPPSSPIMNRLPFRTLWKILVRSDTYIIMSSTFFFFLFFAFYLYCFIIIYLFIFVQLAYQTYVWSFWGTF